MRRCTNTFTGTAKDPMSLTLESKAVLGFNLLLGVNTIFDF